MKKTILVLATAAAAAGSGVYLYKQSNTAAPPTATNVQAPAVEADSVLLSFAFVGCNRVERQQLADTSATDGSSANLSALKRIFDDLSNQPQKPSLLFFLGDLVCAESTTEVLNSQLDAWCKLYNNTAFSNISRSGIELVAVPGNHEMLFYQKPKVNGHDEWPLKGSTDIWMKHMAPFFTHRSQSGDRPRQCGKPHDLFIYPKKCSFCGDEHRHLQPTHQNLPARH